MLNNRMFEKLKFLKNTYKRATLLEFVINWRNVSGGVGEFRLCDLGKWQSTLFQHKVYQYIARKISFDFTVPQSYRNSS